MTSEGSLSDDVPIPDERVAWRTAEEILQKPVLQRSDAEVSLVLTLLSRLAFISEASLAFQTRLSLCRSAAVVRVDPGVTIFTKPDGPEAVPPRPNPDVSAVKAGAPSPGAPPEPSLSRSPRTESMHALRRQDSAPRLESSLSVADALLSGDDTRVLYIFVHGRAVLERHTVNGRVRTLLRPGDAIGDRLTIEALPPLTTYLTVEKSALLSLPWHAYESILRDVTTQAIRRRVSFLQNELSVPILTPWPLEQFRWLAACGYMVHLESKEIAIREGDASDAVYFIISGKMKVVRQVDFTTNAFHPVVRLLDLATLEPGELFGELGILRHRVDGSASETLDELLQITAQDLEAGTDEHEALHLDPSIPAIPRQATVFAHTPATLFVVPRLCFIELVEKAALVRMREYVKGYPSAAAIRSHFSKRHKWDAFKSRVFESTLQ